MTEQVFFNWLLSLWLVVAAAVFGLLLFINAPYGRYLRKGWGLTIGSKLGWLTMESGAAITFACFFIMGAEFSLVSWMFVLMWEAHYFHRAFIYPFSLRPDKQMPVIIVAFGLMFNVINAYLNSRNLFTLSGGYSVAWLHDPRFISGFLLFTAGYFITRQSDHILSGLRKTPHNTYVIPRGGLFCVVSSPNYLGEITIWTGWALATWSLPGLAFAIWTIANLAPRARANHAWYKAHFPDYPADRRALLPLVW
jgi:3-oxo-5-alpha-steroid 4-dehydrogenase 1